MEQFFDNGGREALVVRVANGARAATLALSAGAQVLKLRAVRPGTREFLRASVDYDNVRGEFEFNLTVQRVRAHGTEQVEDQEIFLRLSVSPVDDRYVGLAFGGSELIELCGSVPPVRPDPTLDPSGRAAGYVGSNADGDDGSPLTDYDLIGSEIRRTGLFALESEEYFNFLCIPPLCRDQDVGLSVLLVAARYCKERRALLIVDPPADWHTADEALRGMRQWTFWSENALMYFPRILGHDKLRGHFEAFATCGAVAGMLARSEEASPVWGPARFEEAILRPGYRPSCLVPEDKRMRLAALGVNTIQAVRSAARIGVSPRTLAAGTAGAPDWQSLVARRLALFILNSVERGTRWAASAGMPRIDVAEVVTAQVRAFFERVHEGGAFGDRPLDEAFFVICDDRAEGTGGGGDPGRTDADEGECEFQLLVGFAAVRRREFHSFRIAHSAAGCKVSPVSLNRLNTVQHSPEELEWVDELVRQLRPETTEP